MSSQKYISEIVYTLDYETASKVLAQELGISDSDAILYILNAADINGRGTAYFELASYAKQQRQYVDGYKNGTMKDRE